MIVGVVVKGKYPSIRNHHRKHAIAFEPIDARFRGIMAVGSSGPRRACAEATATTLQ
jgi:hypothetical protein